jgi:amidase
MPYPPVELAHAPAGPLAGLTFAVKDLFDVAGYPTSAGSPHMLALSGVKTRTAPVVHTLLEAGARFIGKTITDELAFSMNGKNAHFGTPVNGAAPDRIPGGSSSGSAAAVSHGLCSFALGTDTGGSVRAPASHCGLFGLRPTHGRISLALCHDLAPSFDTCGFFAADGGTFEKVAAVLLGPDDAPLTKAPQVLLAEDAFGLTAPTVREALAPAIARVTERLGPATGVTVAPGGFEPLYWAFRHIQGREAWSVDGTFIERFHPKLGPGVVERFAFAKTITEGQAREATAQRDRFAAELAARLGPNAVLVLPTMPDVAPLLADSESALDDYRNRALNILCLSVLSRLPQVTIPLASRLGAPLGLSLMGPAGSDLSLVRLAVTLAAAIGPGEP